MLQEEIIAESWHIFRFIELFRLVTPVHRGIYYRIKRYQIFLYLFKVNT